MEDFFNGFFQDNAFSLGVTDFTPKVDITGNDKNVTLKAEIPGMDPESVNVEIIGNVLTISGEKQRVIERTYGCFSRSFTLPQSAQTDKIKARYKNGVLKVKVPLSGKAKSKPLSIKVE